MVPVSSLQVNHPHDDEQNRIHRESIIRVSIILEESAVQVEQI